MWYKCPNCNKKVNFKKQLSYVFDENDEADFDPVSGLPMHTIVCETCESYWVMSISGMCVDDVEADDNQEYKESIEKMKVLMKNHKPVPMRKPS